MLCKRPLTYNAKKISLTGQCQSILLKAFHFFGVFSEDKFEIWWAGYNGKAFSIVSVLIKHALRGVMALQPHCVSFQDADPGKWLMQSFRLCLTMYTLYLNAQKCLSICFHQRWGKKGGDPFFENCRIWVKKLIVQSTCKQRCVWCTLSYEENCLGNIGGFTQFVTISTCLPWIQMHFAERKKKINNNIA